MSTKSTPSNKKAAPVSEETKALVFKAWDDKNTAVIIEAYEAADPTSRNTIKSLTAIGLLIGNDKAASVRSKLTNAGVYVKDDKSKKTTTGKASTSKIETCRAIAVIAGLQKDGLDTLQKGNKAELEALAAALVSMSDSQAADKDAAQQLADK